LSISTTPLDRILVHYSPSTYLYTWVKRDSVRVNCNNTMYNVKCHSTIEIQEHFLLFYQGRCKSCIQTCCSVAVAFLRSLEWRLWWYYLPIMQFLKSAAENHWLKHTCLAKAQFPKFIFLFFSLLKVLLYWSRIDRPWIDWLIVLNFKIANTRKLIAIWSEFHLIFIYAHKYHDNLVEEVIWKMLD